MFESRGFRPARKFAWIILLGFTLLVWLGVQLGRTEPMAFRIRLVRAKLQGRLPDASWQDVAGLILPSRWTSHVYKRLASRSGSSGPPPCSVVWRTAIGEFFGRDGYGDQLRFTVFEQLTGIYERGEVQIRPGDTVIDVGAHLGTFTRVALLRSAGLVVAVDPNSETNECFAQSFKREIAEGRVILERAAASGSSGTLKLSGHGLGAAVRFNSPGGSTETTVPAVTLDELARRLRLRRVDFIKMDIEGAERFALAGASEILAKYSPRMAICTYHKQDDPEIIPAIVMKAQPAYQVEFNRRKLQAYFHAPKAH